MNRRPLLPVGTKSLLFGVHAFWLHPFVVAYAWWKLYGFPLDPRLWVAFVVHDWGYWGCPDMDGFLGKLHPQVGGGIMWHLFGDEWGDLVLYHSRHYARICRREPSKLCAPDKLASVVLPAWIFLVLANLSGEIREYMGEENTAVLQQRTGIRVHDQWTWHAALRGYHEQEARRTVAIA